MKIYVKCPNKFAEIVWTKIRIALSLMGFFYDVDIKENKKRHMFIFEDEFEFAS